MIGTSKWKKFKIGDIFVQERGKESSPNQNAMGFCPIINETDSHNGFVRMVQPTKIIKGNAITISINYASNVFYQPQDFCASVNIAVIRNKNLTIGSGLFVATILRLNNKRYSYGYKISKDKIYDTEIKLPAKQIGKKIEPDWEYMEQFMAPFLAEKPVTKNKYHKIDIHKWNWQKYKLSDLFEIKKGKRLTAEDQTCGTTPYIGAIDSNNGVSNHIGQSPIHKGNTISLSYNGSVGEAFYQPVDYWATDDVNALYPKFNFNKYIGLFICAVLKKEKYRFSYGRKWTLEQMNNSFIKLPSLKIQGKYTPNWNLMEGYIKNLPYGDLI